MMMFTVVSILSSSTSKVNSQSSLQINMGTGNRTKRSDMM